MKRLLIITQNVDEYDDLLGFFVAWIREFAKHYERVTVITLAKGRYTLPENVRVLSLGKERGTLKWKRALLFMQYLWQEVRVHDAVFAHMSPIFAIVAWPFSFAWHKKLTLWYLHRSRTLKLRLALLLCDHVVTADIASLTIHSRKIIPVGHGIDVERFAVPNRTAPEGRPLHIISVGRLSPIKGFETLIRAASILRDRKVAAEIRIVGRAVMPGDDAYVGQLRESVSRLGLDGTVRFAGFVPYHDMPSQYAWADVAVGCTPRGGIDKTLLEAMAAGCIVCTSNDAMRSLLGSMAGTALFEHGNAPALADCVLALRAVPGASSLMRASVASQTTTSVIRAIVDIL